MSSEFDIGPLTWVKGEIDLALERAGGALKAYDQNPLDDTQLKFAKTHLHQAHGALSVVGLEGITQFTEAIEQLLAALEKGTLTYTGEIGAALADALLAIRHFLDDLVVGEPNQPLRLYPQYRALALARGVEAPSASELFFPDLSQRPPRREHPPVPAESIAKILRRARFDFQRGFLQWLKQNQRGLADMRSAIAAVEQTQAQPGARAFWWAALAFFDALLEGGIAADLGSRRLCARIDGQLRKLIGGSRTVADRLTRDVLYNVAVATSSSEQISYVRGAYRLADLLPPSEVHADLAPLKPALRSMRDLLGGAKEDWNRFSAGTAIALPQFHERASQLAEQAHGLGQVDFSRLLNGVAAVANMLRKDPLRHTETVALEIATALLLAENALDNFTNLGVEFAHQVDVMTGRLTALLRGETLATLAAPQLDEMSRRAQERLLMSQVAREVQTNLAQIEQALDAFFRDPSRGAELVALAKPMKQVEGALAMLGEARAVAILRECESQVAAFAGPDYAPQQEDFEAVASKLSGLGFFIEQLQHGPADLDAILAPRTVPAGPADEPGEAADDAALPSFEAELAQTTRETRGLVDALREKPEDAGLRGELLQNLETIRDDASLVADVALEQQAQAAITALETATPQATSAHLDEVVSQILRAPAEPVAPSAETVRLAAATSEEIDAELLAIFIEEANEVLATIGEHFDRSLAQPHDREALTTIRRSFHTLKGSGRMVGLTELGETAWAVEQVMNRWLQAEWDATKALHSMIRLALSLFSAWVVQLEAGEGTHRDATELTDLCEALKQVEETGVAPLTMPSAGAAAPAIEGTTAAPAEAPSAAPAEPEVVHIGDVVLSPTLYDMYLQEARTHLATLQHELHHGGGQPPANEMIRAAHTLAGISATVGIAPINVLAHSLEGALVRLAGAGAVAEAPQQALIEHAVATLEADVAAIAAGHLPALADTLNDDLAGLAPVFNLEPIEALEPQTEEQAPTAELPTDEAVIEVIEIPEAAGEDQAIDIEAPAPATEWLAEPVAEPSAEPPVAAPADWAVEAPTEAEVERPAEPAVEAAAEPAAVPAVEATPPPAVAAERADIHAPETAAPESDRRKLRLADDLDPQLVPIFLEEASDLLREIGNELRGWRAAPEESAPAQQLKRLLHTLKGGARMAGAMTIGEIVHGMESRVEQITAAPSPTVLDELDASFDRFHALIEALMGHPEEAEAVTIAPAPQPAAPMAAPVVALGHGAEPEGDAAAARAMLRVRADLVDKLANEAGEMAIARSRIEGEMRSLKSSLLELTENVIRLRNQLREVEIQAESQMQSRQHLTTDQNVEFDPLEFDRFTRFQELTRMMAEGVNDVTTVQHNLLKNLDHADAALNAQARLNRELSQALMSVRMVPFNSVADRLYRIVRQTAKELEKRANLDIRGGQTELDRSVLEKMIGPLEHLLRNAIGHGLEAPAQRSAAAKAEIGQISLSVAQAGNEVAIELTDDGRGLDLARIRSKAIESGLLGADQVVSDQQLTQMIFMSGFTTAEQLTELSGRGIGMDVVKNETSALGGRIEVQSQTGQGTTFRILLPLTLAVTQAVLVRSGTRTYAIPSAMVAQVQELRPEATERVRSAGASEWMGQTYPYQYLPRLLGDREAQPQPARRHWLLLLKAGAQRLAVEVDALLGNQEIVVKNIGAQVSRVVGVAGATVLGDGEIALILNPIALAGRERETTALATPATAYVETAAATPIALVPTVMVVDDSLTVRKITGRLLAREGYHVIAAKDGVDALEQTLEIVPDVMLVDIEMPRMDGFDLTRNIRGDERLKDVPIIMITSRIADKHRNYAREIGVNHYLGKPYDEEELLRLIAAYVKHPNPA